MDKFEVYDSIKEFINDICESLNDIQFDKYQKLLELTDPNIHEKSVDKHIDIFKDFLTENKNAIENRDFSLFENSIIKYSDNVYVDIGIAFEKITDEHVSIWSHLLVLSDLLVKDSNAKDVLISMNKKNDPMNMIFNLVDKVSKKVSVNENDNIDDVVKNVLESGVVQDVYKEINSEIQNGNFDISQMMGMVSGLLQGQDNNQLNIGNIVSSLNTNQN